MMNTLLMHLKRLTTLLGRVKEQSSKDLLSVAQRLCHRQCCDETKDG